MIYRFYTINYYILYKGGDIMHETKGYKAAMGKRIQQARKAAHLTQMRFAERIEVSTQYVSDLERGIVGCSVPTLLKICDVLDVSADLILRGQEPKPPKPPSVSERFVDLPPAEQALMAEGFKLLKKALSLKDAGEPKEDPV